MQYIWLWLCLSVVCLYPKERYTNALIHESSPYLRQHAHNPVNWYPWGKKAFQKAKREKKLIFLSIGYSTCHWCHVMEKESFTDEAIAKLLNAHFVSIKVDREEYPQLDKKYQRIYMHLHGRRGGWPLSVFLSPEGEVVDIRTYIPKEEGYGSEGLMNLLPALAALQEHPDRLIKRIETNKKRMASTQMQSTQQAVTVTVAVKEMRKSIAVSFDSINGGFSRAPKFPEASKIDWLLTYYRLYQDSKALEMATYILTQMAHRGIYDQIGGGFFRYATDSAWQYPHFEKMLYTNAQMISVYANAYVLTGDRVYKKVVDETIAAMRRHDVRNGLFISASDADSDGEEGGYYIFSYEQVKADLIAKGWRENALEEALAYYGIEEDGNVDGELSLPHITAGKKPSKADALKRYLKALQAKRHDPFVDAKIITAWNAMMINALFDASKIEPKYAKDAIMYFDRLWKLMVRNGRLYHQSLAGAVPKQTGMLEDYAYVLQACISAYERTYDADYLKRAVWLAKEAEQKFYKEGKWYLSDDEVGVLADFDDKYYTAPLPVLWSALLRLASLREDLVLYAKTRKEIMQALSSLPKNGLCGASSLVSAYLQTAYGNVVIHASAGKLLSAQKEIDRMQYPFVLSAVQASDAYLACRVNSCFAADKNITGLIKKIETRPYQMQQKGVMRWQKR